MAGYVEVWRGADRRVVELTGPTVSIGREAANAVALVDDAACSAVHALLEPVGPGWCVRDLGSRNGTSVNGSRIYGPRLLRDGDDVTVGGSRLRFQSNAPPSELTRETGLTERPPALTVREREVVLALCRPLLNGDLFIEPATVKQISDELSISTAAVKQHLSRLYDKFGFVEEGERGRGALANAAVRRAAVSLADLGDDPNA